MARSGPATAQTTMTIDSSETVGAGIESIYHRSLASIAQSGVIIAGIFLAGEDATRTAGK